MGHNSPRDAQKPISLRIFRPTVDLDFETDAVPLNGRGAGKNSLFRWMNSICDPTKTPQNKPEA